MKAGWDKFGHFCGGFSRKPVTLQQPDLADDFVEWTKGVDIKPCPRCNAHITKLEGCNHVNCKFCKLEFCWLCRREYKPGHFNRTNFFGCPGGENATEPPGCCGACCGLIR